MRGAAPIIALAAAVLVAAPAAAQVVDDQPGAASRGPNDVHVFTHGADDGLWAASWTGGDWSAWGPVGGRLTSGPGAAARNSRVIDVFVRGIDNAVYHRTWDGTTWSPWVSLGGVATSMPAAAPRQATSSIDLAVRGSGDSFYHRAWDGAKWSPWGSIEGQFVGGPAVVSYAPGYVHIFGRGSDDALWVKWWNGAQWSAWVSMEGKLSSPPAAVSQQTNLIDVFARGADGAIWQRSWGGSAWGPWTRIEGEVSSGPAAVAEGLGKMTLFARRGSEVVANVYDHGRGPQNGWSGWQPVRPPEQPPPPPPPLCGGTDGPQVRIARRPRGSVRFGSRPRLTGSVRSADGSPAAGADVRLVEVGRDTREIARARASRTGRFRVRVPRGPSRTIQVGTPAAAPAGTLMCSRSFRVRVRAGVTLRVPRRVRGRRIGFRGRLRAGPIPRRGLLVQLEAFEAGRWRQFRSVRTNRRGRFRTSYRLQRTTSPRRFRFRARVRAQPPYPYALGSSRAARVRVVP